jgi:hypothetical protein
VPQKHQQDGRLRRERQKILPGFCLNSRKHLREIALITHYSVRRRHISPRSKLYAEIDKMKSAKFQIAAREAIPASSGRLAPISATPSTLY